MENHSLPGTHGNGRLIGKACARRLGAAASLGKSLPSSKLIVGLVGEAIQPAADRIATCGSTRFLGVAGADFAPSRYATDAAAAEALAKAAQATLVLAPGTCRWNRVLPGVAQRLGGRADTHVTGISAGDGAVSVSRWYYRQTDGRHPAARATAVADSGGSRQQQPWQR